ncbi:MAG: ATP-dependent RNA helicase HrpA [Arachnia propionica]|nr:MAG: ATP-dependent RNA helicase HrpA [Arachnia propionica]
MATSPLNLSVDQGLPIAQAATEIADLIQNHQVLIVAGETGSGKTTQLPKICLAAGRRSVAHTQPRRIAARTVAERIAAECGVELGHEIGYQVRFVRRAAKQTRLKVMTDGVLLNELTRDRLLRRYDTIIVDEAHERSLNIDFLLGYLKQLIGKRPELRVIVTSATIDTGRFAAHFGAAPIVTVSGRTYPVEVQYQPLSEDQDEIDGVVAALRQIDRTSATGDVLVFLPGEREIRDTAEALSWLSAWQIVPLFSRLAAADQQRVFQRHSGRRVVLATNVAETSITVPGIRFVVDVGTARISRYSARTKVQRLPIERISQASANQRAGRCGRLGPGVAIRLYSEEDFLSRPEYTDPEILRTNLATVILLMAQAGLGDIEAFPFLQPPVMSQISDGLRVLTELGALAKRKRHERVRLTRTGRQLARLPVDPRLGRMLIEANRRGCLRQVMIIVAGLSIADVRERPAEKQQQADELHRRFLVPAQASKQAEAKGGTAAAVLVGGDFEVLLNVWEYLTRRRNELSGNAFRRMCRQEYLHFVRFREWQDLVSQLAGVARELDLSKPAEGPMSEVLISLLSGLLSNVGAALPERAPAAKGKRRGLREYQGARGARFAIQPGSALAGRAPELVMAFELVETSRLWARTVAVIQPEWVEAVGGQVLTRTLSQPRWAKKTASVVASERLSLFGVPIIAGRTVGYAAEDPQAAREIFIRSALVEGEWEPRTTVLRDNRFALAEAEQLCERMRRPELLISDDELFQFYADRIAPEVVSGATMERWLRDKQAVASVRLTTADCLSDPGVLRGEDFPDYWENNGIRLPVRYVYEPGAGHDGVTIEVGLAELTQLDPRPFTWQVPGLRDELAVGLIRTLPKALRKQAIPAPDVAARSLAWLRDRPELADESFQAALAIALRELVGLEVGAADFQPEALPSHLRPRFVVLRDDEQVAAGTDLAQLALQLRESVRATLSESAGDLQVSGQTEWTFGEIASVVTLGGVQAYPGLIDETVAVGLGVCETAERAASQHRRGLGRLLTLVNPSPVRWVVAHLSNPDKLALGANPYASVPELLTDAWVKASLRLLERHIEPGQVRDQQTFERVAAQVRADAAEQTREVVAVAAKTLALSAEVERRLANAPTDLAADIRQQLSGLVFERFISTTPDPWYDRLPKYLAAMLVRLAWAAKEPARHDRAWDDIDRIEQEYAALCDRQPPGALPASVEEIAFLIEELRISLFAQSVGAAVPVSMKRVRQAIRRCEAD